MLPLGACVPGVLRAVVGDQGGCPGVGAGGMGTPEVVRSGRFVTTADVSTFVLCVVPAGMARELLSPTEVLLVNVTGEGVVTVVFSDVLLESFLVVSSDTFFLTKLSRICRGSRDVLRLSEKYKEEMQMSTRAVHILRVSQEQGWAVPEAPIQTLSGCRRHPAAWPRDQRQLLRVCSQAGPSSSLESCGLGTVCSPGEVCVLTR